MSYLEDIINIRQRFRTWEVEKAENSLGGFVCTNCGPSHKVIYKIKTFYGDAWLCEKCLDKVDSVCDPKKIARDSVKDMQEAMKKFKSRMKIVKRLERRTNVVKKHDESSQ